MASREIKSLGKAFSVGSSNKLFFAKQLQYVRYSDVTTICTTALTPPNLKQIRYDVLTSLSTFFADKHFHIGTLDKRRFELHSYGAVENSRGGDGEEFASQAKKRNGRMSRHRRRARLLRSHLVRFFGALYVGLVGFFKILPVRHCPPTTGLLDLLWPSRHIVSPASYV